MGYYLKSARSTQIMRKFANIFGEAYVIQGEYDLAKDQLATIPKLSGSTDCENYEFAGALKTAHAL